MLNEDSQNDKVRFKPATTAAIQNGDTIYYYGDSGQINIAIVIS